MFEMSFSNPIAVTNWIRLPCQSCQTLDSQDSLYDLIAMAVENALSVWMNLGKHLLFIWLFVSSIKTGTRRINCLNELFLVVGCPRRVTEDSLSRCIMLLVPVFILETINQTNNKYRVRNCTFLVANATKYFALATRISQLVASGQLTISCHDHYTNKNFDFQPIIDWNKI